MSISKDFISLDKKHSFSIDSIGDTTYFTINYLSYEYYKTFLLLLKIAFEYMVNNNIKYVKLRINEEDKINFKRSSFIQEDDVVIVKIVITDFLLELCDALGIQRL